MGSTKATFNDMLNEYLTNELMSEELIKRNWLFKNIEKVTGWKGGTVPVPFTGAKATSAKFGGLTPESEIGEFKYVRGEITTQKELWGSLIFNQKDLDRHQTGKVNEDTFLKILPGQMETFMGYMEEIVSVNLLQGSSFASASAAGNASGVIAVDRVDRFEINQKCVIKDGANEQALYVTAINIDELKVTLSATKGGAGFDLTAAPFSGASKFYHDGVLEGGVAVNMFNNLKDALLSAANGGSASIHGQSKLAYPYLQAYNHDGSSITAANILDKAFDAFSEFKIRAKASKANKLVMSFKNLGSIMKAIEVQKGAFKVTATSSKAELYSWTEIEIVGVRGSFTIVGIQEMPDDVMMLLDMGSMKFLSNGLFEKRQAPDGKSYYELRSSTNGYQYIVDVRLYGELQVHAPANNMIIHSISY